MSQVRSCLESWSWFTSFFVPVQDCAEGTEETVTMLKAANSGLCRACYYLKRGSLQNMKMNELIANLNDNQSFRDKHLGLKLSFETASDSYNNKPSRCYAQPRSDADTAQQQKDHATRQVVMPVKIFVCKSKPHAFVCPFPLFLHLHSGTIECGEPRCSFPLPIHSVASDMRSQT